MTDFQQNFKLQKYLKLNNKRKTRFARLWYIFAKEIFTSELVWRNSEREREREHKDFIDTEWRERDRALLPLSDKRSVVNIYMWRTDFAENDRRLRSVMRAAILGISNRRQHGKSQFASDTRPARSVAFREIRISLNYRRFPCRRRPWNIGTVVGSDSD